MTLLTGTDGKNYITALLYEFSTVSALKRYIYRVNKIRLHFLRR